MKTFLRFITAMLLAVTVRAATIQGSTSVDPQSTAKNPVTGGLALEQEGVRLGLQFSAPRRVTGLFDLVYRNEDTGLVLGAGLVADDMQAPVYVSDTSESDTTVVNQPHDNGKHKGDKHKRPGKTVVSIKNGTAHVSIGNLDLNLVPSIFLGVSAYQGLFVESRVLFDGGNVSNRVSVGVRF